MSDDGCRCLHVVRIGRKHSKQCAFLASCFASQDGDQNQKQQEMQHASQRDHHSHRTDQNRSVEGMPAACVDPCGDQIGSRFRIRKRRKAGPQRQKSLDGEAKTDCQGDQAHELSRMRPGDPEDPWLWPCRKQMTRDQGQLRHEPPLTATIVEPTVPAQPPACERLFPVGHGGGAPIRLALNGTMLQS